MSPLPARDARAIPCKAGRRRLSPAWLQGLVERSRRRYARPATTWLRLARTNWGLSTLVGKVGASVTSLRGEVSDPSTYQDAAALASERTPLTTWVNNAAADIRGSIHRTSQSDLDRAMKITFGGAFWGMAAAVPATLTTGHGSIINTSSERASFGYPGYAAYAAAKGAVVA